MATLEDRRAAAEARKAKATASIKSKAKAPELEEIEAIEREAEEAEALASAIEAHGIGRVRLIRTKLGPVVVKAASKAEFQRWLDSEDSKTPGVLTLVRPNIVTPVAHFDSVLAEYPAVLGACLNAITTMASDGVEIETGK